MTSDGSAWDEYVERTFKLSDDPGNESIGQWETDSAVILGPVRGDQSADYLMHFDTIEDTAHLGRDVQIEWLASAVTGECEISSPHTPVTIQVGPNALVMLAGKGDVDQVALLRALDPLPRGETLPLQRFRAEWRRDS